MECAGDDKKLEFTTHLVEAMIKAIRYYLDKLRGDQKNINITIKGPNQISHQTETDATMPKISFDSFNKKQTSIETWMPQVPTITNSMRQ